MSILIETKNLTKYYGKHLGIENVNLQIKEGEIFGFIGPNGAGKSTMIRTLLGLIHPTGASATIFGRDCIKFRDVNAKDIGYLPSEVFYYENMKVKDLLAYSASFYEHDCRDKIHELCTLLELDAHRKIDDLSYGNRKKVGIVQGLLHSPKLIILDEPTSGLDPLMQHKFFELIRKEHQQGATIFFSSHILGEVQRLCNRVAIIKEGRIIKIEQMEDLRKNTYKKVEVQCKQSIEEQLKKTIGIRQLQKHVDTYSFLYTGSMNALVAVFAQYDIENLDVQEPDLEEIFLHYYQEDCV